MSARFQRREWAWLPLVVAAMLLIYLPGLGNDLVYDDAFLTDGLFSQYASLHAHVRMLSYGSFVWVHALLGDGWWKQRLVNLALHLGVVLALWALYREILRHIVAPADEPPYAASPALGIAIGFFALNPAAVYAVGYLIQRSIVMATLFCVLGLWLFAVGLRRRRWWLHGAALACYALAVMSKEYAVLMPLAALPLYVLVARPGARRLAILSLAGALLVALAAGILFLHYRGILGKPFDEYSHVYLAQLAQLDPAAPKRAYPLSILNEAYLFFRYGIDWLIPYSGWMSINLRPPFPVTFLTFPQALGVVGYLAILGGGFYLLLRYRDWRALLGISLLFPALLFPTEFATVWVQDPFVLYRSYLWAIGVPGIVFILVHGPSWRVLLPLGLVIGALLAWQALDRVLSLGTKESAWSDAIQKLPSDPRSVGRWFPYLNRGAAYVDQDRFALALRDFESSAALGDQGMGMVNKGSVLSARGRQEEALAAFDAARGQGYDLFNLHFQRALALERLGRLEEAYGELQATLARDPSSPTRELALLALGRVGMRTGHRAEAIAALQRLLAIAPGHAQARYLLGMAYVMGKQPGRAREVLDPLFAGGRGGAPAYYARALANYELGRKAEALADIDAAIRLGGENPNLRAWREKILAMPR